MSKKYKIKRYRHIYRHNRFSPVHLFWIVLIVAILAFLAFSLYGPVRDFISGKTLEQIENSSAQMENVSSQQSSESSDISVSSEDTSDSSLGISENETEDMIRGLYVPEQVVLSGGILDFVHANALPGMNTVLIDLKNENGQVLYQSALAEVSQAGAQRNNAIDLKQLSELLEQEGFSLAGRIYAFKDPIAPRAFESAAVKYQNSVWSWLDAAEENGGKPWLNPYSEIARAYILNLAREAANLGVKTIILDAVQFPEGFSLEKATYGTQAATISKKDCLVNFINQVQQELSAVKVRTVCEVEPLSLLGYGTEKYGAENPANIFNCPLALRLAPASFGVSLDLGGQIIENPAHTPFETVDALLTKIQPLLSQEILPMIQGYTDTSLPQANNKEYSKQDIDDQIRALDQHDIKNYILLY